MFTGEDVKSMYIGDIPLKSNPNTKLTKKVLTPSEKIQYTSAHYNIHIIGIVKMIVDAVTLAKIELQKDGEPINNDFSVRLERRISRNDTYQKFMSEMIANYLINTESFAIIQRDDTGFGMDSVKNLRPVDKSLITIESDPETDEAIYVISDSEVSSDKNVVYGHDMVHFRGLSFNGLSAVDLLKSVLTQTLQMQDVNDSTIQSKIKSPASTLLAKNKLHLPIDAYDPDRLALYQSYMDGLTTDRDGNSIKDQIDMNALAEIESFNDQMDVLSEYLVKKDFIIYDEDNLSLELKQIDPNYHNYIDLEATIKSRLEKVFNLPVGYLSISSSSTEYSKVFEQFIKVTIQPILRIIESELTRKLLTDEEYVDGYRIKYEEFSKWQTSLKDTMESLVMGVRSGLINPETSSKILGTGKRDGDEAKTYYISGDLKPIISWYEQALDEAKPRSDDTG